MDFDLKAKIKDLWIKVFILNEYVDLKAELDKMHYEIKDEHINEEGREGMEDEE